MAQMSMILVMGVTGSGKSHFINKLVEGATTEFPGMRSGTKHCQLIQTKIGDNDNVAIVDTPGFDDTTRSDAEIFSLITKSLMSQYQLGISLKGIIYLHRITDPKMQGSALRNFQMFEKICGEKALKNVVLLTTMWDKLKDETEGFDRDQELREDFWSLMEENGSYITKFDGSKEMAEALIAMLYAKEPIVLSIQKELQDEGKRLEQTSAGQLLLPDINSKVDRYNEHIKYVEGRLQDSRQSDQAQRAELERQRREYAEYRRREESERQKLRARVAQEMEQEIKNRDKSESSWKDKFQLFATLTGVAVNVVMNLLPVLGISI